MSENEKNILDPSAKHDEGIVVSAIEQSNLQLLREANAAEELEKSMTFTEALKLWWPAVLYSCAISTGIIMEGYDYLLLAQFYAMPSFCKRYGKWSEKAGRYEIPAPWQAALSNGCLIGEITGLYISGFAIERYGYRKTMLGALGAIILFVFIPFFAKNLIMLEIGEILCGVPWGIFQTLTCAYASDVVPIKLRPYLTTYTNLCWVIGQLIGSGVLRGFVERPDEWSYRIPFAIQWFWPVPIGIAAIFAPESPWWLVRKDKKEEARRALEKLTDPSKGPPNFTVQDTLSMMIVTNNLEMAQTQGAGFLDCFKGSNLRRTEISCITWAIQNLCGSAFMGYSTYFFIRAGLPTVMAFSMSLVQYGIGFFGTLTSWFLLSRFGRRTLFGCGLLIMFTVLLSIGSAALFTSEASAWAVGGLLIFYTFIYNCTIGPLTYSIVSEIPSTRLKTKTVVLARNCFSIAAVINYIIVPYMLNPTAWNWGGRSGFFWAGICFLSLTWTYFRLPEPKDRSYADLDELFEHGVSARKFSAKVLAKG